MTEEPRSATSITYHVCTDCGSVHLELRGEDGTVFATAVLPTENYLKLVEGVDVDLMAYLAARRAAAASAEGGHA